MRIVSIACLFSGIGAITSCQGTNDEEGPSPPIRLWHDDKLSEALSTHSQGSKQYLLYTIQSAANSMMREDAIHGLQAYEDMDVVEALVRLALHGNPPGNADAAAGVLGGFKTDLVCRSIYLEDWHKLTAPQKTRIAMALIQKPPASSLPLLRRLLGEVDENVRFHAYLALIRMKTKESATLLANALSKDQKKMKLQVAPFVGYSKRKELLPLLISFESSFHGDELKRIRKAISSIEGASSAK